MITRFQQFVNRAMSETDPIIHVEDLHFVYNAASDNPIVALRGINLEVQRGEYLVIVGHNGSGKSTLARNLNALLRPTRGNVWVKGMNTRDPANTLPIRSTVGMVFQIPDNQIVATVVEEDVAFGPENLGVPEDELRERVEWALDVVDMLPHRHRPPHRLSAGQKQRVAIAGVIAMKPEVLVLDEATSMLDPEGREKVLQVVRYLNREEGVTVIAITHFMHEAAEGDRVIVMEAGRIVMEGPPRRVFSHVEELHALQLDVPQTTHLSYALHQRDPSFPPDLLLVEEVVEEIYRRARGRGRWGDGEARRGGEGEPVIQAKDLHYAYLRGTPLEVVALRGVDMTIFRGEAVGIIGRTGAGKSTVVQHFNGLIRPQEPGRVIVDGQDLSDSHVDVRALRRKVGLVFQYPEQQLFERLVGDDIAFGPKQMGLPRAERRERVKWAMEMVGLDFEAFKDRYTFSLSGGEMRKVALAGVLALQPEVLILDESTSGIDPRSRKELLERIDYLHRHHGLTVVFVSSNMEDLAWLVDRIYVMDEGRTVMNGPTREIFSQPEELARHGLGVPQVSEIFQRLKKRGIEVDTIPVTVPEAEELAWRILSS